MTEELGQNNLNQTDLQAEFDLYLQHELSAFVEKAFETLEPETNFVDSWHIAYVCELLMAQSAGDSQVKDLIINIPPRTLKSIMVTVAWSAWDMGRNPALQFMAASFSASLSTKHNVDARQIVESDWYKRIFPDMRLADDQNTKTYFKTTKNGHRFATSVGATPIGFGGDRLIVDDPIGAMQAESDTVRDDANMWFKRAFTPRRNNPDKSTRTVVMQRLHSNDLTGVLRKGVERAGGDGDSWYIACVPLVCEASTIIDFGRFHYERSKGDILQPDRFTSAAIADIKEDLGSYGFAGQYQQRPVPAGGGIFNEKWFKSYQEVPIANRILQSWDTAGKGESTSAYSVCTTFAETDEGYFILDVCRCRLAYPQLKRKVISLAQQFEADVILIEDKSSGEALIQDLRDADCEVPNLPVIAIMPEGDKEARAGQVSALCEAGRVHIPDSATWLTDWLDEIATFPKSQEKDQVDSLTQGLNYMRKQKNRIDKYRITAL